MSCLAARVLAAAWLSHVWIEDCEPVKEDRVVDEKIVRRGDMGEVGEKCKGFGGGALKRTLQGARVAKVC